MNEPDIVDPFCDPCDPKLISFDQITSAAYRIKNAIRYTECIRSEHLSNISGMEIYLKKEFLQATGSFKERGARFTMLMMSPELKSRGIVAASAGNHALACCYHGLSLGIPVTVVMPESAPIMKVEKCRQYKGNVILQGKVLYESKKIAQAYARDNGMLYINGYDHPQILAGQGSIGLEIWEQVPGLEAIIVPVGGGGILAGISVAVKSLDSTIKVYGVEPERAACLTAALKAGKPVDVTVESTIADGLAVAKIGVNSFECIRNNSDKCVTVKEQYIALAILRLIELEKSVVEGAGATPLAAILQGTVPELKGKRVCLVLSGGNIDTSILGRVLDRGLAADGRLVKVKICISDRVGGIEELTSLIGNIGVHIKDIHHERAWVATDVFKVAVKVICECRDRDHSLQLRDQLIANYGCVIFNGVKFPPGVGVDNIPSMFAQPPMGVPVEEIPSYAGQQSIQQNIIDLQGSTTSEKQKPPCACAETLDFGYCCEPCSPGAPKSELYGSCICGTVDKITESAHPSQQGQGSYHPSQQGGGSYHPSQQEGASFHPSQQGGGSFHPSQQGGGSFHPSQQGGGSFHPSQQPTEHSSIRPVCGPCGSSHPSQQVGGSLHPSQQPTVQSTVKSVCAPCGSQHPSQQGGGSFHPSQQPTVQSTIKSVCGPCASLHPSQQGGGSFHPSQQPTVPSSPPSQQVGGSLHPSQQPGGSFHPSQQPTVQSTVKSVCAPCASLHPSQQGGGSFHPSQQPTVQSTVKSVCGPCASSPPSQHAGGSLHPSQQAGGSFHPSQQTGSTHPSQQGGGSFHPSQPVQGSLHLSQQPGVCGPCGGGGSTHPSQLGSVAASSAAPCGPCGSAHPSQQVGSVHPSQQVGSVHPSQQVGSCHPSQQAAALPDICNPCVCDTARSEASQQVGSLHPSQQSKPLVCRPCSALAKEKGYDTSTSVQEEVFSVQHSTDVQAGPPVVLKSSQTSKQTETLPVKPFASCKCKRRGAPGEYTKN